MARTPTSYREYRRWVLGQKRLKNVLKRHGVANQRTLEQKISDAGPSDQRINPHILTNSLHHLIEETEEISKIQPSGNVPWYHLADADETLVRQRLEEQLPIYEQIPWWCGETLVTAPPRNQGEDETA